LPPPWSVTVLWTKPPNLSSGPAMQQQMHLHKSFVLVVRYSHKHLCEEMNY
jgi:hypothetical protein